MIVERLQWENARARLRAGDATLVSLWGEPRLVHMALWEGTAVAVQSLPCPEASFPSIGPAPMCASRRR